MEYFAKTSHKLSDNSTTVTVTSSSYYQNAFGNVSIRSTSRESHCWQFKILKNKESYGIDIGIIEDNHLNFEESFTSKGFGYGLCSNGNIYSANCNKQNYKLKSYKQKYKPNDIVLMTLDLNNKTLSFVIDNHTHKTMNTKIIIPNIKINQDINYRMAIYLSHKKDSIKLLNHIKTLCIEEKKEKEKEIIQNKIIKYEEMISKLENEFLLTKQTNNKYKNNINLLENELKNIKNINELNNKQNEEIINKLKNELIIKENENNKYKNNINILQNELKNIKKESAVNLDRVCKANEDIVEKLQTENDRFIDILREQLRDKDIMVKKYKNKIKQLENNEMEINNIYKQNDEYKQSNNRLQSRILTLQKENQSLRNNRDQTQRINLNTRKQIESLQTENNQLKKEIKQCKSRK